MESRLGVSLPVTAVFDFPSIMALAGYIHAQLAPASGAGAADGAARPEARPLAEPARSSLRAAIVTSAGRASPGLVPSRPFLRRRASGAAGPLGR